ncbi:MAG: TIGR01777 family protein [Verrucomicrobia bacterium]|jgi:uncharacterized protein (TIGR01777 family)|nr:TIGR01777 family protein [Verrucomicrobiota bacterium]
MSDTKTILVTGASGLIGTPLCAALRARGHTVRTLSRSDRGDFKWDVAADTMDTSAVDGVDAIVHLAGESIAQRWTESVKVRIMKSRVDSTRLLVDAALEQSEKPIYIGASGISFYGIDRDDVVDESSETGQGFLAEVAREWEGAAQPLEATGVRCAYMRTGIVLSAKGGALAKMLTPFKLGVGGRIGDGQQMMSWISLEDLVQAYVFAVENDALTGPVNAVAPEAVSNADFTKTLGKVLGRPTIFPLPTQVVKALFGDMGKETVLSNLAVLPGQLIEHNFQWQHATIEKALQASL